jgi:chromosome segregation ATPase
MAEDRPDLDTDLRANLCLMNQMFDSIIADAKIPVPDVPDVDLTTSDDFSAMGEMLLGKLAAIEKCCDTAAASAQKKYDARAIRDKIAVKRRQLAELEAENAALVETAKRQERALRQLSQGDEAVEAQQNVLKLRQQLAAAQKEIKALEERRHGLLAENRRLKGQMQATQKAAAAADTGAEAAGEEELARTLAQLETKRQELDARRQREQTAYQKKMQALKEQKERLTQEKADLEQKLRDKQKELELIHSTASKSRFPPPLQARRK